MELSPTSLCRIPGVAEILDKTQHGDEETSTDVFAPKPRTISKVLLVGSATRIPSVRNFVKEVTGLEPCTWMKPEEAVAMGAAIQAGVLLGNAKGIELADGSFSESLHGAVTGFQGQQYA